MIWVLIIAGIILALVAYCSVTINIVLIVDAPNIGDMLATATHNNLDNRIVLALSLLITVAAGIIMHIKSDEYDELHHQYIRIIQSILAAAAAVGGFVAILVIIEGTKSFGTFISSAQYAIVAIIVCGLSYIPVFHTLIMLFGSLAAILFYIVDKRMVHLAVLPVTMAETGLSLFLFGLTGMSCPKWIIDWTETFITPFGISGVIEQASQDATAILNTGSMEPGMFIFGGIALLAIGILWNVFIAKHKKSRW